MSQGVWRQGLDARRAWRVILEVYTVLLAFFTYWSVVGNNEGICHVGIVRIIFSYSLLTASSFRRSSFRSS